MKILPPPTTQSVVVDGDPVNGKFNDAAPIPVTMGTEHLLSFTIDFGDMLMSYDFTDTSADNNYGWGDSFKNGNNKITLTNNSTCNVNAYIKLDIDEKTYPSLEEPDFCFTDNNQNSDQASATSRNEDIIPLSYDGAQTVEEYKSFHTYLNVLNLSKLTDMHNYNFNNAKIGEITIELTPVFGTILTEEGYYVKVTEVSSPEELLSIFSYEEALSILLSVFSGIPYYFGPYETEVAANSIKTQLDESSTCSIVQIS